MFFIIIFELELIENVFLINKLLKFIHLSFNIFIESNLKSQKVNIMSYLYQLVTIISRSYSYLMIIIHYSYNESELNMAHKENILYDYLCLISFDFICFVYLL